MKTTGQTKSMDIRLNSGGEIDVEYYMRQARLMRAAYMHTALVDIKQAIKRRIVEFYQKFICLDCQPSH